MLLDVAILSGLFVLVIGSTLAGIVRGRRLPRERRPENEHLGTIQGAFLGLLGLLLGFAFAGAMSRFVDRQDRLASEANAIETAFDRGALMADSKEYRSRIASYARERVALFDAQTDAKSHEITNTLSTHYRAALGLAMSSAVQSPQFSSLFVQGVEAIDNELSARNAVARRHLPAEFTLVMIGCSCVAMFSIGFGVGVAERRSVGTALALAGLVSMTLFMTLDFDRPQGGFIRLDPTPIKDVAERLARETAAQNSP